MRKSAEGVSEYVWVWRREGNNVVSLIWFELPFSFSDGVWYHWRFPFPFFSIFFSSNVHVVVVIIAVDIVKVYKLKIEV